MVISNKINLKIQKNRFSKKPKIMKSFCIFGDCSLTTKNEGRIEFIQLNTIKKIIKTFIKKKKSNLDVIREKIWYFGRPNFYIQKKSKNSRMGKGKGLVERKVIRIRRGVTIFEFYGISIIKLKKLTTKLNKFLNVKLTLRTNKKTTISLWSKQNKFNYYHEKYLIF